MNTDTDALKLRNEAVALATHNDTLRHDNKLLRRLLAEIASAWLVDQTADTATVRISRKLWHTIGGDWGGGR